MRKESQEQKLGGERFSWSGRHHQTGQNKSHRGRRETEGAKRVKDERLEIENQSVARNASSIGMASELRACR